MAAGARTVLIAAALAPLPLLAAVAWNAEAEAARGPARAVVSVREGDLYVGERQLTTGGADADPDWSPDRRRIAFVRQDRGKRSSGLYVIRRDGGGLVRLTRGDQVVSMPAWSGDGRRIAYAASPLAGGSFDIWTTSLADGARRRVASGPAEQVAPSFSRSGAVSFRVLEPGEAFPEKRSDAGTPQVGPRELLPDLDQRAPFRLTIAGTKLGFASATDNVGEGPVWVRGSRPIATGPMRASQLVRLSDRSVRTYEDAGRLRYTPSSSHTHWHLLGFQRYELRTLDGKLVVRDRKSGFCLADHYGLAARRVTAFTGSHFLGNCAQGNPGALSVEQGTSIGFTDLYPANFHGQNLELRGVPAGVYLLIHRANPEHRLEELDYTNNDASLRLRLTWRGATPHVQTLRTCQASAAC
ncbi:MAG TPA: lysyl oxidase family protein [Solirubrobacteraceae bacterium]|nr:lysyl oxidase family protein [Solirubrobacteraceae bacterium]